MESIHPRVPCMSGKVEKPLNGDGRLSNIYVFCKLPPAGKCTCGQERGGRSKVEEKKWWQDTKRRQSELGWKKAERGEGGKTNQHFLSLITAIGSLRASDFSGRYLTDSWLSKNGILLTTRDQSSLYIYMSDRCGEVKRAFCLVKHHEVSQTNVGLKEGSFLAGGLALR